MTVNGRMGLPALKGARLGLLLGLAAAALPAAPVPAPPDILYGPLFAAVERSGIFPDQKTFCDCLPREAPAAILAAYRAARHASKPIDLRRFVAAHFIVPGPAAPEAPPDPDLARHLRLLWRVLRRGPDHPVPGSSLLPLPYPYVVPGGRFRELYYWDSYFIMLGLLRSGDRPLASSLARDLGCLATTYGHVPNGNRTYYLSRSQPPFLALMVELLADRGQAAAWREFAPALQAELDYWSDRTAPTRHSVRMPDGSLLSRYYDQDDTPRPEAWGEDEATAAASSEARAVLYRNLRSAAESGWDFSSRWLDDGRTLGTIDTLDRVPVDLNCLLCRLEGALARARRLAGDEKGAASLEAEAARRQAAILRFCWSDREGFFVDYDLRRGGPAREETLAGVMPLFCRLATPAQARSVARVLRARFLKPGGLVATLVESGQQWDAPNGWAPLEWIAVRGLENYGCHDLAAEIARRWLALNRAVYARTGRMMEKYNVENLSLPAGGGEYPDQDGFGWTNGVYQELAADYGPPGP